MKKNQKTVGSMLANKAVKSAKHEAPAKKEMSLEDQANHNRMVVRQGLMETANEMKELIDQVKEKGFHQFVYPENSVVEIPGEMFAHILIFMTTAEKHHQTVNILLGDLMDASANVMLGASDFQVYLTKMHIENCEKGIAQDKTILEKKVPAEKKKAKGSKA